MGRVGCGAVSQVRSRDGGVRSERWIMAVAGLAIIMNQFNALANRIEGAFCF